MNELRALQIRCSAAKGLAECERDGAALLTESAPGKKPHEVAGATVGEKSAGPANQDGERRSPAGKASGRSHRNRKPSEGRGGNPQADVESVAELIAVICNEPDNRKKRLKLAEALRDRGLNESKLAAMYSGVAEK